MTRSGLLGLLAGGLAAFLLAAEPLVAQPPTPLDRPTLRIGSVTGALRLDGILDEPAWSTADSIADLIQIEPIEGKAATGRTVVRVLGGGGDLVIGILAFDPEPGRITSFSRARDASLTNEDHIRIVLDTYLDGRSGYVFVVNPNGARYDALVTNQGESENAEWDAVWEAAAARTAFGWSLEIRIPAKSLLFRRGLRAWGFNVQRRVQRLQETDRWASPDRDVKINMTSRAGLLTEVPAFALGIGLSVRPSLTLSAGHPSNGAELDRDADASLDITQRLGSNSLASLTVNTDFAETDVDTRRTNLTRFPLVFPEKRTFFLEGSDIFDFGLGIGTDADPFFSRRIGLLGGREVPLDAGLKANGRIGQTSYGGLVVRTGRLDSLPTRNTMGVMRIRHNLLNESSAGIIATMGDPLGRRGSWMAGADLTYQTTRFMGNKNFLAGLWGLGMDREGLSEGRYAVGGKIDYPNDLWDAALTFKRIGESFDPSLGFVPRAGVHIINFNVNFQPRPSRPILGLPVRQMFHELLTTLVTDLDGRWESYRVFTAPINWRLESGDRFEINVVPAGERLTAPFAIADTVVIPAGSYHWTRYRLEAGLASKRKFSGQFTWWFGRFFSGTLSEVVLTASWKPSPLFIVEWNVTRNSARLAQGAFKQEVIGTRLRVNLSPDFQVNSYVQYDNQSRTVGTHTRLRWTFTPLGDLFVVYNHNLEEPLNLSGRRAGWRFVSNELLVKGQFGFRY